MIISNRKVGFTACGQVVRCLPVLAALLLLVSLLPAQTAGTGSVAGIVADAKGTLLVGASIDIKNQGTGAVSHVVSSSEGLYSSGPVQPGSYELHVQAKGFAAMRITVNIHAANTATVNVVMLKGEEKPAAAGGSPVNLVEPAVQGMQYPEMVERLPISGRNIVDLAELEPGVQLQDGASIDATKNGISAIALLNHPGRSPQVSVDGLSIDDETVGATTQNVPPTAIREFQIGQSSQDISTGLTSSGSLNIITRSGSNDLHGIVFGTFRGDEGAAALPGATHSSFQQEQYGGAVGGAVIRDKVFLFADAERNQQNLTAAESFVYPFNGLTSSLSEPYRDFATDERVDWNLRHSTHAFYRFNYFDNSDVRPFSSFSSTQLMSSKIDTLTNALGVDFSTGAYIHSLRFEYLKLRSNANDATSNLSGIANPIPGLGINIGASVGGNCDLSSGGAFCGGPGWLGPQQNIQSDAIARYDGSRVMGAHIIRFGAQFNDIDGAHLANYSAFPQVGTTWLENSISSDPTSYNADYVSLGNGIGAFSNKNSFGLSGGGFPADNRIEAYAGDDWKASPKLTLTLGLHYVHDTGRTDSNLGALPVLNQWGAGYGSRIRNPKENFAPQFGFAWDASGNEKTVIRGGAGLVYANTLWSNSQLDTPARLANGNYLDAPQVCTGGSAEPFIWPAALVPGSTIAGGAATALTASTAVPTFCGGTISSIAPSVLALSSAFQSAAAGLTSSSPNNAFVGTALKALNPSYDLLYPNFLTPRSYQMNLGVEQEFRPGTILSFDYVRDIGEHFLIGQDINRSGAARSFNYGNAVAARDSAQLANGCPAGLAEASCMIAKLGQLGAQAAYSSAGLDSNVQVAGGGPCAYCAFPGQNTLTGNLGQTGAVDMMFPSGRSLYTGFQGRVIQKVSRPWRGIRFATFQASYTYSKFISQIQEQNFANLAIDNDAPTRFTGPEGMDRKHQISFGGTFDLPLQAKLSMVGHFFSPLPQNLLLPELTNGGEIFATDWLGAGLGADALPEPVPGTSIGEYQRSITDNTLPKEISNYNHLYAGKLTPAGACLVANGTPAGNPFFCSGLVSGSPVMTSVDMSALGWVMPTLNSVAPEAVGIPWLKTFDLRASWPLKVRDRFTIEPSATVFNVFNFWNASFPGNYPSGSLAPGQNGVLAPNVVGGVTPGPNLTPFRTGFGSGTFAIGAPRNLEFGLRISF